MVSTEQLTPSTSETPLTPLLDKLQSQISSLESEFEQSKQVWRTALASERSEFQIQMKEREATWAQREADWADQKRSLEQHLRALNDRFQTQLKEVQDNALQALNSLESAWQKEKMTWHRTLVISQPSAPASPAVPTFTAPKTFQAPVANEAPKQTWNTAAARPATYSPATQIQPKPIADNANVNQTLTVLAEQVQLLRQILQNLSPRS